MSVEIPNSIQEGVAAGRIVCTLSVKLVTSVEIVQIAKTAGYDGIFVDMEHSSLDLHQGHQICLAALYAGIATVVRVPANQPAFISRALDGGANGIVVPHIDSAADAQRVVNAAKFTPIGKRSSTLGLPQLQLVTHHQDITFPACNKATLVIPMIETLEGLKNVDSIAALNGVDALLIGTNDLSCEMGIPGQYDDPRIHDAFVKVIAACKKHGKFLGIGGLHSRQDLLKKFTDMGARWVMAATDGPLLLAAATKVAKEIKQF